MCDSTASAVFEIFNGQEAYSTLPACSAAMGRCSPLLLCSFTHHCTVVAIQQQLCPKFGVVSTHAQRVHCHTRTPLSRKPLSHKHLSHKAVRDPPHSHWGIHMLNAQQHVSVHTSLSDIVCRVHEQTACTALLSWELSHRSTAFTSQSALCCVQYCMPLHHAC